MWSQICLVSSLLSSIFLAPVQGLIRIHAVNETPYQRKTLEHNECLKTLDNATSESNGILTQDSFLRFARIVSDGAIDEDSFDASKGGGFPSPVLFRLLNIYWVTVCTVDSEGCKSGDARVSVADIENYETPDGSLADNFCTRFEYLLEDVVGPSPTRMPTVAPSREPTRKKTNSPTTKPAASKGGITVKPIMAPSSSPTKKPISPPTPSPSNRPTATPTKSPTLTPTRNPTASPTRRPSFAPSPRPSKRPSRRPSTPPSKKRTLSPTLRTTLSPKPSPTATYGSDLTLTFSVEFTVDDPIQIVEEWTIGLIASELENLDSRCSTRDETNECPYKFSVSISLVEAQCFDQTISDDIICGLMDLSISITSHVESNVETILSEIDTTFRNSIRELEDDLLAG